MRILCWRSNVHSAALFDAKGTPRYVKGLPRGHPDISGVIPPDGRALFVECKVSGRKRSPWQVQRHADLQKAGAIVLTVTSVEDLRAGLGDWGIWAEGM